MGRADPVGQRVGSVGRLGASGRAGRSRVCGYGGCMKGRVVEPPNRSLAPHLSTPPPPAGYGVSGLGGLRSGVWAKEAKIMEAILEIQVPGLFSLLFNLFAI